MRNPFRRRNRVPKDFWKVADPSYDLGSDPLDPHGDGSIQYGDPMWDLMMESMRTGKGFIANRRDDGQWQVDHVGDPRD